MDSKTIENIARDMRQIIRTDLGRHASESEIRTHFEDGILEEFVFDGAISEEEAEAALELAIDNHNAYLERGNGYWG